MINVKLPEAPGREIGSNKVTFRILDDVDIDLLRPVLDSYTLPASNDLLITLEPSGSTFDHDMNRMIFWDGGYIAIAEIFQERHAGSGKAILSELWDLFEGVLCNSDWDFPIPNDDEFCLTDGAHMYKDDYGEIRVITGYWKYLNFWRDDPLKKLFVDGYIVLNYHDTDEGWQFFYLPAGAEEAWKANDIDTFYSLMEAENREQYLAQIAKLGGGA